MIINAFMPFCFFAQTPLLSVSPSTFSTTALMLPASSLERHYSPSPFDNPTLNGTLLHQDLDLALYQRARAKVDKYREGYAAHGLRHAFLPAIVSTSGRIHGELLRLLFNLADMKTSNSLAALGEAIDVESEVYCRRRSGNFWRMRAALGLACAQAATLGTQVVGRPRSRPRYAARPRH